MLQQGLKFGLVGVVATGVHVSSVIFLVEALHLRPVLASAPAFLLALIFSYLANHSWTFAAVGRHVRYFSRYAVISLSGLLLNLGIMYSSTSLAGGTYQIGLILVILLVPILSFILHRFWTFVDE